MHHTVSASDCLESASGESGVEAMYADESIWLSQKMMGELYNVNVRTVSEHLRNIFNDSELEEEAVIRNFRITATDGKNYNTKHYNLKAIIAVGYKVNSERAVQFRKWATDMVSEYTSKAMFLWSKEQEVSLSFIQPGKPAQNAFVESLNGKFRNECLNQDWFRTLAEATYEIEQWRQHYNDVRPHSSLNYQAPPEYAKKAA